jgi:histidine triad (HIT) family protein
MSECIFCDIIAGKIPSSKVLDTETVYAFRDIHPQAPHHILILPKKHVAQLSDVAEVDRDVLADLMVATTQLARELKLVEPGFRVVINNGESAGQSVFHLHVHLLSGRPFAWPPG